MPLPNSPFVQVNKLKSLAPAELAIHLAGLLIWLGSLLLTAGLSILLFLLRLMRGQLGKEEVTNKEMEVLRSKKKSKKLTLCKQTQPKSINFF